MKHVNYRGGVISFAVPENWHMDFDPDGSMIMFADDKTVSNIHIHVMTMKRSEHDVERALLTLFRNRQHQIPGAALTDMNGHPLLAYEVHAEEAGRAITMYRWETGQVLTESTARIAFVTYSIRSAALSDAMAGAQLSVVERIVHSVSFSPREGILPS